MPACRIIVLLLTLTALTFGMLGIHVHMPTHTGLAASLHDEVGMTSSLW